MVKWGVRVPLVPCVPHAPTAFRNGLLKWAWRMGMAKALTTAHCLLPINHCPLVFYHSVRINHKFFGGALVKIAIALNGIGQRNNLHINRLCNLNFIV